VDAEQLERIKMQIRASETYARDDAGGLAQRYGQALTQGLTVADVQAWPEILEATTAEEIMQAAREVLDRTQSVTGWLMAPEVTQ
jgi:zinc protease